jgi:hypothetical protein
MYTHTGARRRDESDGIEGKVKEAMQAHPMGGCVTERIASFACAMTQFLGSRDMHHLSRVSRCDRSSTDKVYKSAAALLQTSVSLMQVLRTGLPAICVAVAETEAWRLVLTWVKSMAALPKVHCGPKRSVAFSLNADDDDTEAFVVLDPGPLIEQSAPASTAGITMGLYGHDCPADGLWRLLRRCILSGLNYQYRVEPLATCTSLFLEVFVEHGAWIDHLFVGGKEEAEFVIPLWFGLDVGPELRMMCRPIHHQVILQLPMYQQHRARIVLNPIH